MLKLPDIRGQISQRLRELFPTARNWEESTEVGNGRQTASLLVKFQLGEREHAVVLEVSSLGQPRQIRAAVTRLEDLRREMPAAYPAAAAVYIGPESARILKSHGVGYIDLSGNCHLALENVLIEKEGKRNIRASTRPLRSLFAPRATRIVRVLLSETGRAWRLGELARAAEISLGHAHNVVKRLEELAWLERDASDRLRLSKPADLLESWSDAYTYRENDISSYAVPERITRKFLVEVAHAAEAEGRRYAFTMSAGLSLVAPHLRMAAAHVYLEGDPAPLAARLGLRPVAEADGALHLLRPYDGGVFYGLLEKGGLRVTSLPQLFVDLAHCEPRGADQAQHLRREAMGY
jgi:hypothetical protein